MHIAIVNATSGGMSGGYEKYLRRLTPLLRADRRVTRISMISHPDAKVPRAEGVDYLTWAIGDSRRGSPDLRARLAHLEPAVVFIPNARLLGIRDRPTTVMVRNMEPLVLPFAGNSMLDKLRNVARRRAARVACRDAVRVIAVSRYVRDFLVENWLVEAGKIATVYHGVDAPPDDAELHRPVNLPAERRPMLFSAGSVRPARGLEDAIQAVALLARRDVPVTLALAGVVDRGAEAYQRRLIGLAESLGVAGQIAWLGRLDAAEMGWCFRHTEAVVLTTRIEACPNVALEAMSYGATSVVGNNPPLPEFFRDAALYYVSTDAESLAERLLELLATTPHDRAALGARAARRANDFSWQTTASRTLDELDACRATFQACAG
jgi:glycosyltransferase involved in cell wall biosynthesis